MSDQYQHRIASIECQVIEAMRETEQAHRRINNLMRPGRVAQVDHEKYLIKVEYAKTPEGQPVLSPWIPWTTRAGKIKEWSPPSVDEQIMLFSPSGNIGTATWAMPGGYSNKNPQNHDKDAEWRLTIGNTSITVKDGQI